jgi:hypothetical protein
MRFILLVSILISTLMTGTARADMVWHDAYKSPLSDWGAYQYYRNVKQPMAERGRTTESARPQAVAHAPMSATDFRRTTSGRSVVMKYVAALPLDASQADQLTVALDATMAQLQKVGRKNNVATALAATIAVAHMVLDRDDLDTSKADTLVVSLNDALAATPEFTRLGPAGRQQMADELLLSSAVIVLLHQHGAVDASKAFAERVLRTVTGS